MTIVAPNENTQSDAAARASGSSFYVAMRILPRRQRQAMFEIYAFCRAVDDIADDTGPRPGRLAQLQQWRKDIDSIYAGAPSPRLRALAQAAQDFGLRREDFLAVIEGMEMDVTGDIRAPDLAALELYCDRVASAVGRLSVRVFGLKEKEGLALAHHLGRALQLTNILRDLDEDAAIGRLYLPRDTLAQAGIAADEPAEVLAHPELARACAVIAALARLHFEKADKIMARCGRRAVRAPRIMSVYYQNILKALVARGWAAPRRPVRLGRPRILWILLRYAVI